VTNRLFVTAFLASTFIAAPALAQAASAPAQGPQPISKTAFMQRIDSAFVAVDANKDGFTDRAEIEAAETKAFAARKAMGLKEREAAFRKLDTDKNGSLTLAEFNAVAAAQALPKPNAAPVLDRMDTNKDGKISLAENRAPAMTQFDRADTNKDGTLSVEEQKAAAAQRRR
jgi:Ca2+-binding EF-hand superfamily protein